IPNQSFTQDALLDPVPAFPETAREVHELFYGTHLALMQARANAESTFQASLSQVSNYMDEIRGLALRGVENAETRKLVSSNWVYEPPTINFPSGYKPQLPPTSSHQPGYYEGFQAGLYEGSRVKCLNCQSLPNLTRPTNELWGVAGLSSATTVHPEPQSNIIEGLSTIKDDSTVQPVLEIYTLSSDDEGLEIKREQVESTIAPELDAFQSSRFEEEPLSQVQKEQDSSVSPTHHGDISFGAASCHSDTSQTNLTFEDQGVANQPHHFDSYAAHQQFSETCISQAGPLSSPSSQDSLFHSHSSQAAGLSSPISQEVCSQLENTIVTPATSKEHLTPLASQDSASGNSFECFNEESQFGFFDKEESTQEQYHEATSEVHSQSISTSITLEKSESSLEAQTDSNVTHIKAAVTLPLSGSPHKIPKKLLEDEGNIESFAQRPIVEQSALDFAMPSMQESADSLHSDSAISSSNLARQPEHLSQAQLTTAKDPTIKHECMDTVVLDSSSLHKGLVIEDPSTIARRFLPFEDRMEDFSVDSIYPTTSTPKLAQPDSTHGPIPSPKVADLNQPCNIPDGVVKIPTEATLKRAFGPELVEDEPSSPKIKKGKFHHPNIAEPLSITSCCQDTTDALASTSPDLNCGLSATAGYVASEPTPDHAIPKLTVAEPSVPESTNHNLMFPGFAVAKPAVTEPTFPSQVASELADHEVLVPECVVTEDTIAETVDHALTVSELANQNFITSDLPVVGPAIPTQVDSELVGYDLVVPESVATEYAIIEAVDSEHNVTDHLVPEFMAPISESSEQSDLSHNGLEGANNSDPAHSTAPSELDRSSVYPPDNQADLDISQGSLMSEDYFECDSYETISASEYATPEDGGSPVLVKRRRRRRQVQSYQLKVASSRELSGLLPLPREVATPYMLRRTLPADTPSKRRKLNPLMPVEGGPTYATSLTRAIATPYTLRENDRGSSQNPDASNPSLGLIHPKTPHSTPRQNSRRRQHTKPPPPNDQLP
ncbi:hypothetical protein L0F63_005747, partial [Massospora cicadina]